MATSPEHSTIRITLSKRFWEEVEAIAILETLEWYRIGIDEMKDANPQLDGLFGYQISPSSNFHVSITIGSP